MTKPKEFIVVEQGELWKASLNARLQQRGLVQLRACGHSVLPDSPTGGTLLCLEITPENLADRLNAVQRLSSFNTLTAALLDRRLFQTEELQSELQAASLQAGACLALVSPRQADRLVEAAIRWFQRQATQKSLGQSPFEQAIARLPWQPAVSQLG